MIKKFYVLFLGLLVLAGVIFLLQSNLKGKAITKIKWSHFISNEEVASSIDSRLRQEIKDNPIVFLGVEPGDKDHLDILKKWANLNSEPDWRFDEVLIEPELPFYKEFWPEAKEFDIRKNEQEFIQHMGELIKLQKRILVILPQVYASQVIPDNPVSRIIKVSQQKILSITLTTLEKTALPCVSEGADFSGQSSLGCKVKEKTYFAQRKKNKATNGSSSKQFAWSGMLEQYGLNDYLMFLQVSK